MTAALRKFDWTLLATMAALFVTFQLLFVWGHLLGIRPLSRALRDAGLRQGALLEAISDPVIVFQIEDRRALFVNGAFSLVFSNQFPSELFEGKTEFRITKSLHNQVRVFDVRVSKLSSSSSAYIAIFSDVSGFVEAESKQTRFVADVSHELKTPITSIRGFAETLEWDLSKNKVSDPQFARFIVQSADKLMELIQQMLSLTKIEDSQFAPNIKIHSTSELTNKALARLAPVLNSSHQKVETEIHVKTVRGDAFLIEQVLFNLIENACKYGASPEGIAIKWAIDDTGKTILEVRDKGKGIPEESIPRLFDRYFQVDESRTKSIENQNSVGLGLSIVRQAMIRQKGTIEVRSQIGKGTTFVCTFLS